jgi:hypothetical protein
VLLVLPELGLLADDLALKLLVLRDQRGFLGLVMSDQGLLPVDHRLLQLGLLVAEVLLHEAALGFQALLETAPLSLVLVLVGFVQLVHPAGVRFLQAATVLLDDLLLLAQARLQLDDFLLEFFVERVFLADERLAVVLDQVLDVAFVAAAKVGLLGLDLLVEQALLALEVLFLRADGLRLDLQALDEGHLRLLEGFLLVGERGLQFAFRLLAGDLDRVDDLAAQGADLGLARGDLALEHVDLHGELEALLLDMSVLLEGDLLAQFLAHFLLEAGLVLHRGFPDLDRLAPALDRLIFLAGLVFELVLAAGRRAGLLARLAQLRVHLVQALQRPAQGEAGGIQVVDVRRVEVLRGLGRLGSFVVHGFWTRRRSRRESLPEPCYVFIASPGY